MKPEPTFRFDDVCVNTDMNRLVAMTRAVESAWPGRRILWALSPLVAHPTKTPTTKSQRVYSKMLATQSDYRAFYKDVDIAHVVTPVPHPVVRAAHGLIHIDHRVLPAAAQEMSMLVSCSLAGARVFVPPKNMWTDYMELVAAQAGIELVRFEDGWLAAEYNKNPPAAHALWYTHDWAWDSVAAFEAWVKEASR